MKPARDILQDGVLLYRLTLIKLRNIAEYLTPKSMIIKNHICFCVVTHAFV